MGEVLMRPWVAVAVSAAAIAVLASSAPAQSLAEIAARTKKKEEGKPAKPAKVYTESDLRGRPAASGSVSQMEGQPAIMAPPAAGAVVVPPAGEKPKTEEEERAEKQAEWRARLQAAESDVARISEDINRAQTALNDLRGALYGGNRADMINRVDDGKRQLAAARQLVEDIQEEGRRARYR